MTDKLKEAIADVDRYLDANYLAVTDAALRVVLGAAKAHLETLPKTKVIDTWLLQWVIMTEKEGDPDGPLVARPMVEAFETKDAAEQAFSNLGKYATHRAITGPHKHTVPA